MKYNHDVVNYITTLEEDIQNKIMQVMNNSQLIVYGDEEFQGSSDHSFSSLKVISKHIGSDNESHHLSRLD